MDDLSDPCGDRVMKDVPPIARWPLKTADYWHKSSKSNNRNVPNLDVLRKHLLREGHLDKPDLVDLIKACH